MTGWNSKRTATEISENRAAVLKRFRGFKSEATRGSVPFVLRFAAERKKEEKSNDGRKKKKSLRSNVRLINNASSTAFNCASNERILYF